MHVNHAYQGLLQFALSGAPVEPRGQKCFENLSGQTIIHMDDPIMSIKERKLDYEFMFAEAHWICSGSSLLSHHPRIEKNLSKYSDDHFRLTGAYGPPFLEQLRYVVEAFTMDTDTRQAVATLWRQNPRFTKDMPCTVAMQWIIRDGDLNCIVFMRSSDAYMGWPYDQFTFTMMSAMILIRLRNEHVKFMNLRLGHLYTHMGSSHIYERNIQAAKPLLTCDSSDCVGNNFINSIYGLNTPDDLLAFLGDKRNIPSALIL